MKVLFVCSGNSKHGISPIIRNQGDSIIKQNVHLDYFEIQGRGIKGYLKNIKSLRKYIKKNNYDVIHAHYILSGLISVLAFCKTPIVLSLMGSDAYGDYVGENKIKFSSKYLILLTYIIQPFVNSIICKSKNIQSFVYLKNKAHIIPNGILLNKIKITGNGFKDELGLSSKKKNILFLGNKSNIRKNFSLIEDALNQINSNDIDLISPYPIPHDTVIKYLNSVDVLVVPSFMEGSPNVIKEAMACNCPVVATDVGDISWLFGDEAGYFITGFVPEDIIEKIKMALEFSDKHGRTNGRHRIKDLGLESEVVTGKIIDLYKKVIREQ